VNLVVNPLASRLDGMGLARVDAPWLAWWIGFPIALGIFSGWNQIGMIAPALPLAWSIIYWLLLSGMMWAGLGLGTAIVWRFGRSLPYPVILVVGAAIGVALTRPVHASFQALFAPLANAPVKTLPLLPVTASDWVTLYAGNALLMIFWVFGGLFFAVLVGYRPFDATGRSSATPVPAGSIPAAPRFAARLTKLAFDRIEAIGAEDHYIRCTDGARDELLLYRFADAITELDPANWVRIHRSWAVRRDRIRHIVPAGRTATVELESGKRIGVSERYRALVQSAPRAS
jgi:LytTr DNA-binding domain